MIPKPEEVLNESGVFLTDWEKTRVFNAMKEYGRRLLDHVAEEAKIKLFNNLAGSGYEVDKQSILKIKDEL